MKNKLEIFYTLFGCAGPSGNVRTSCGWISCGSSRPTPPSRTHPPNTVSVNNSSNSSTGRTRPTRTDCNRCSADRNSNNNRYSSSTGCSCRWGTWRRAQTAKCGRPRRLRRPWQRLRPQQRSSVTALTAAAAARTRASSPVWPTARAGTSWPRPRQSCGTCRTCTDVTCKRRVGYNTCTYLRVYGFQDRRRCL